MDDTITKLDSLIEKAMEVVRDSGVCSSTINLSYIAPFRRIRRFCEGRDEPFSVDILDDYADYVEQRGKDDTWTKAYYYINRHAVLLLIDCAGKEEPIWHQYRKSRDKYVPTEEYIELAESIIASLGPISASHATRTRRYLRQFFCYMEKIGIEGCDSIDNECTRTFITDVAGKQTSEMSYLIYSLRVLFDFLATKDICHTSIDLNLYNPPTKSCSLIPSFSKEEVRAMLAAIDTSTVAGKRSMAIMLLAITTGLRGCDITALRLGGIDWAKGEVCVIQKKTMVPVVVPLLPVAGNALVDYLLNGRPSSRDDHVFLTLRAPYRPIVTAGSLHTMLEGICAKAKIEKIEHRAFHSLRRSSGTWMAEVGIPIQTIAQVLGHASVRSSMPYIAFDPATLEACPLDFTYVPLAKGGVYAS